METTTVCGLQIIALLMILSENNFILSLDLREHCVQLFCCRLRGVPKDVRVVTLIPGDQMNMEVLHCLSRCRAVVLYDVESVCSEFFL